MTKVCTRCGEEKPLSHFLRSKRSKTGYHILCKDCGIAAAKQISDGDTKTCTMCGVVKPFSEFFLHPSHKNGRHSGCKQCQLQAKKRRYQERATIPLRERFLAWRRNAKGRAIPFEITVGDLEEMPMVCHYTGRQLILDKNKYDTVSLDRLDSSKGYTKDNVVFCCEFINRMKMELTYNQFIYSCTLIANHAAVNKGINILKEAA